MAGYSKPDLAWQDPAGQLAEPLCALRVVKASYNMD